MTTEQIILDFAVSKWGEKSMSTLGLKLGEESGEVLGAITKIDEGRATVDDLYGELGDVLIVVSQFAALLGTTIEGIRADRFNVIKLRGPCKPVHQPNDCPNCMFMHGQHHIDCAMGNHFAEKVMDAYVENTSKLNIHIHTP